MAQHYMIRLNNNFGGEETIVWLVNIIILSLWYFGD